ncbi:enterobactin synthetase component D [Vibrio xiamenensis]|uniref:Enterobactin synthase component D n=1 Tax=Vibrio xiamenensis TaxID=861298 RepID=A0A1G8H9C1_9VIBR|nr:4'-phosphopantetheinyl transferase superfamily protein [Vibrio xiamenensis]SDI03090.1 enterobactin synthetase component D [Vibrio xiamenensis]
MKVSLLNDEPDSRFFQRLFKVELEAAPELELVGASFESTEFEPQLFTQHPHISRQWVTYANRLRQAEFFAGRYCADLALQRWLGKCHHYCVAKGEHGEPIWPEAIVGSIAHSRRLALAVATQHARNVGLDCEPIMNRETAMQVADIVCRSDERLRLDCDDVSYPFMLTLLFSAKESIYKAIYANVKQVLDFDCVELIAVCQQTQHARFRLMQDFSPHYTCGKEVSVYYAVFDQELITIAMNI